ncbi:MAG: hypothetical protein LQ345_006029 [Seirophora villosa]|nr:MAG: hypothetical protein LQ345_006029 [Seirophora villosa]
MLVHLLDYSDEPIAIFYVVVNIFKVSESTFREHMLKPFAALINVNRVKLYMYNSSDIIQGVGRPVLQVFSEHMEEFLASQRMLAKILEYRVAFTYIKDTVLTAIEEAVKYIFGRPNLPPSNSPGFYRRKWCCQRIFGQPRSETPRTQSAVSEQVTNFYYGIGIYLQAVGEFKNRDGTCWEKLEECLRYDPTNASGLGLHVAMVPGTRDPSSKVYSRFAKQLAISVTFVGLDADISRISKAANLTRNSIRDLDGLSQESQTW